MANNKIHLFQVNSARGIIRAGYGSSPPTIILTGPVGVILDADKNLFIMDQLGYRLVRLGPAGFLCLFGCSFSIDSITSSPPYSASFSFDRAGNIFYVDYARHQIEKLHYSANGLSKYFVLQSKKQLRLVTIQN